MIALLEQIATMRAKSVIFIVYIALIICPLYITQAILVDVFSVEAKMGGDQELLTKLEAKNHLTAPSRGDTGNETDNSPFVEGSSLTTAGAALQKRVDDAMTKVGGNVLSTSVELQSPEAKEGYLSLTADAEMDQSAIQPFLYDIEGGYPFLLVNSLTLQPKIEQSEPARMRMQINISGRWRVQ
jgi:general secretion pathway protein M